MSERKPQSWPFLRNLIGQSLDDASMQSIPHAKGELYWHVTYKTAQMGSILGLMLGPLIAVFRGRGATLKMAAMNGCRNGMLIGAPLGPMMTYGRMSALEKEGHDMDYAFYDRAYRLRNNRNQVRVDRASGVGEVVGLVAAVATSTNPLTGIALGITAGTVAGGIYNSTASEQQ